MTQMVKMNADMNSRGWFPSASCYSEEGPKYRLLDKQLS